jgi:ATP-dependent Lhr-like helicase
MQRGYRRRAPELAANDGPWKADDEKLDDFHDIAAHLFKVLRGSDNLIFANSRTNVELFADLLRRMSENAHVPNEFLPHHGSLSKDLREHAERQLKSKSRPGNVVATTTLEMGIDVGTVRSIAQIGNPPSVASMRQRLGRSGRDQNEAAVLRIYISERDGGADLVPQDALRAQTIQSIAMVQLMLDGWLEPPDDKILNLSTLVQQLLSIVAQHGGVRATEAWSVLCENGPFRVREKRQFASLLRSLGEQELLTQTSDQLLVLGVRGEQIVDHYEFYAAFFTPKEFQIVNEARPLGSLPIAKPLAEGSHLIFAGRRWEVVNVDAEASVVTVKPSRGGRPPMFDGGAAPVHDKVRRQMFEVYCATERPGFADAKAQELLEEGRRYFRRSGLEHQQIVEAKSGCHVFPWVGDKTMNTLELLLGVRQISITNEGVSLNARCSEADLRHAARELLAAGLPAPEILAERVSNKLIGKYDAFLSEDLLNEDYASARLDVDAARAVLQQWADGASNDRSVG